MNNFTKFSQHLKDSISSVFLGARIFHNKGYTVKINQTVLAPSSEEWENYADNGDLEISARVEVKRSSLNFTCENDFPYEHPIICGKNAFDRADPKPIFIMIINKSGTHYMILHCDTRREWFVKELGDKRYGPDYKQKFYLCNRSLFTFIKI